MTTKLRAWLLLALVAVVCGASVWGVIWYRSRPLSQQALLRRLPSQDTLLLYVDFSALRKAGVLQLLEGSKAVEEPDYQTFVRRTRFDYRQDLDSALVAFAPQGNYMFIKGRFDWKTLRNYVESEGGNCSYSMCKIAGSTPDRRISFLPLPGNLMALAVSSDPTAVTNMTQASGGPDPEPPSGPVWLSVPNSLLRARKGLPAGTGMFASAMERAESVTLSFVPEGDHLSAKLEVRCFSDREASDIAAQLSRATDLLREMILREHHTPNPADFSGVLSSGAFHTTGQKVTGNWTIDPAFVRNVLSGDLN